MREKLLCDRFIAIRSIHIRMVATASTRLSESDWQYQFFARRAVLLIGSGTLVGLAVALAAGRLLEQILYGVEPTDPLTLAIVFVMMLAIAALACWIPARRAIRINPVTALRQE